MLLIAKPETLTKQAWRELVGDVRRSVCNVQRLTAVS